MQPLKTPRRQREKYAAHADTQERTRAEGAENSVALGHVQKFTKQRVDVELVDEDACLIALHGA